MDEGRTGSLLSTATDTILQNKEVQWMKEELEAIDSIQNEGDI